jgi:para-nitrobenzyl esterase
VLGSARELHHKNDDEHPRQPSWVGTFVGVACVESCCIAHLFSEEEAMMLKVIARSFGVLLVGCGAVGCGTAGETIELSPTTTASELAQQVEVTEVMQTDRGTIRGFADGSTYGYVGVPYAAAPVGNLRWRAPADIAPWSGTRDAIQVPAPCAQISGTSVISSNEDCLNLNVWAPAGRVRHRPVMVWLHGGGNFVGNPFSYSPGNWGGVSTRGRNFVEQFGVVFVSVYFRQGALGFLAHSALDATSESATSGNYGILDQIAALRWVQHNIASFGGDPRRVTVFGQSSGADDICALLASPLASGLFANVIMESPFGRCEAPTIAGYEADVGAANVQRMGCAAASDVAACLRSLPVLSVLQGQVPGNLDLRARIYTPIIDGFVLPASPVTVVNNSPENAVPFIIGSNADETSTRVGAIPDATTYINAIAARFGGDLVEDILALYPLSNYSSPRAAFIQLTTDEIHTCPVRRLALAATKPGIFVDDIGETHGHHARAYRYFFPQVAESDPVVALSGSFHTLEVMYVFAGWNRYSPSQNEIALSNAMRSYWCSIAGNGNPSYAGGVGWPKTNVENAPYLELAATIARKEGDAGAHCDFWDAVGGYVLSRSQGRAESVRPFYSNDAPDVEEPL